MPAVLTNPPFADFRWTLDQALIWIATRAPTLVNEASSRAALAGARTQLTQNASMQRRTWMSTRMMALLSDDDEPTPFLMPHGAAETALWEALCRGAIEARVDEDVIPAWWFADAVIQNCDPDRMVFVRRRDKPLILATSADGTALGKSLEREEPRFSAAEIVAAFPPPAEPALGGAAECPAGERVKSQQELNAPTPSRKIAAVIEAMRSLWPPDGLPPEGLLSDQRDRALWRELAKTGRDASSSTIKRAVAWLRLQHKSGRVV